MADQHTTEPRKQQPIHLLAMLDQAIEDGDIQAERQARQELRRLGITVHYPKSSERREALYA